MGIRISLLALAVPAVLFAILMAVPAIDETWGTSTFHFRIVSAASLLAAAASFLLILSARSFRETRIFFLAMSFFALGAIFSVHGLTTPGHFYHAPTAAIARSPWLATLAAASFAALSVVSLPGVVERARLRVPMVAFAACVLLIGGYVAVSLAWPNWAEGFPTQREWFQHVLTATTVGLLLFAAWRYFDSYLFTRLSAQLSVMVGLLFIAEAQVSMDFGRFLAYSWWLYHGLFLAAFLTVVGGWACELLRAREVRAIAEAIAMRDALAQLNRGRASGLVALADRIEQHDLDTFRHVDRVAAFAYLVGRDMGFGASRLRKLVLAGQMHDIGKIGLPPYILTKTEKLTDEEWAQIKLHPAKGWDIVSHAKGLRSIARMIRHHHERFDGRGYPDGLAGEEIPLESRIISVADTFDALTSERPYRPALSIAEAEAELRRVAGTQLDPVCVETFLKLLDDGTVSLKQRAEQAVSVA